MIKMDLLTVLASFKKYLRYLCNTLAWN